MNICITLKVSLQVSRRNSNCFTTILDWRNGDGLILQILTYASRWFKSSLASKFESSAKTNHEALYYFQ